MKINNKLKNIKILVTGGAGFIGSNICRYLLKSGSIVSCLDNFSTGHMKNIEDLLTINNFTLITGDIRNLEICQKACNGIDYVLHHAALGSVPRSINDPITSNEVNVNGFLNMLVSSRDNNIKRFIYAASSSTYGDSKSLPKIEDNIGKPLSPYAITKFINELYSDNFKLIYDLDYIGLRYFNVYGPYQDPNGAYAAVIPKFINNFLNYESPIINGKGNFSRDFTYIDNVIQMNVLAILSENKKAINQVYNTAVGERTTLIQLVSYIKKYLVKYDSKISNVNLEFGPEREGDIPHSLASIIKAKNLLSYKPSHNIESGIKESIDWYWKTLKK